MWSNRALGIIFLAHHFWLAASSTTLTTAETPSQIAKPFDDGDDLEFYLSRPNLRPPKFEISHINVDKVEPGYWFVSPYVNLRKVRRTRQLQLCQEGPHIYDQTGQLIWSGACDLSNLNVHDFKVTVDGRLSLITGEIETATLLRRGSSMIMDNTYRVEDVMYSPPTAAPMNMHEFTYLGGDRAIFIKTDTRLVDAREINSPFASIWVADGGFEERNIKTGQVYFDWMATEHASLAEGATLWAYNEDPDEEKVWDWLHPNAVDKDSDGNYLLSARHTDTIYKISSIDGSIIWRLGGKYSSFEQIGFNFSRQHDVRFRSRHGSKTIISFLNNGSDEFNKTAITSAAYFVELDTDKMTAKLLKNLERPDGKLTELRGNVQALPQGNTFVSWSENGYMSEFDPDGNVILEAKFTSNRFVNYRSYKFPFVAAPHEPIALKCYSHSDEETQKNVLSATICYVSWNGATEVRTWNWYGTTADGKTQLLGTIPKKGFETSFALKQSVTSVYVEAADANDQVLGTSEPHSNAQMSKLISNTTHYQAHSSVPIDFIKPKPAPKKAFGKSSTLDNMPRPVLSVLSCVAGFVLGAISIKLLQWQCREGFNLPNFAFKRYNFTSTDYTLLRDGETRGERLETPIDQVKADF